MICRQDFLEQRVGPVNPLPGEDQPGALTPCHFFKILGGTGRFPTTLRFSTLLHYGPAALKDDFGRCRIRT